MTDYLHFLNLKGDYIYIDPSAFIIVNDVFNFIIKQNHFISIENIQMISNDEYLHKHPSKKLPKNIEIFIWIKNNIYLTNCVISLLELSKPMEFHTQLYMNTIPNYNYSNDIIAYYSDSESDQYYSPDEELSSNSPTTS